jgi:glutaconyl-CoA/methylmalonyl-CoA decarboxylase subunit gamma
MKLKRVGDSREFEVEIVARDGAAVRARIGGREVAASVEPLAEGGAVLTVGDRRWPVFVARRTASIVVGVGPQCFELAPVEAAARRGRHLAAPEVTAPMPGKVLKVLVKEGDRVKAGDVLVVLEAMKMETTLVAEGDAIVRRVRVAEGATVDHGAVLVELSPPPNPSARESAPEEPR